MKTDSSFTLMCALTALVMVAGGVAGEGLRPTPRTGTGPFFPVDADQPRDADLTRVEGAAGPAEGTILYIRGRVLGTDSAPAVGAQITVWQVDRHGLYDHPRVRRDASTGKDPGFQYWGKTTVADDGSYGFKTILPTAYAVQGQVRPRHVHFLITHPAYQDLATELNIRGDAELEGDFVTEGIEDSDRLSVDLISGDQLRELKAETGARLAQFDIVLEPR